MTKNRKDEKLEDIRYNCVMTTSMLIMNFINAMPCMCARPPSFGTSHFGRLLLSILAVLAPIFACTLEHAHHPTYYLRVSSFKMAADSSARHG